MNDIKKEKKNHKNEFCTGWGIIDGIINSIRKIKQNHQKKIKKKIEEN